MPIDIDRSFYNTGTATVAANGTTVTGQGTSWAGSVRANDMFGTHKGDGVRILSVDSNTQLTLAYPWLGGAQTAAAYEIQFTPYDVGYQQAVRELLQIMASGNVEALAGITGAADTMAYFTGAGTMDETAINAWARSMLGLTGVADRFPYLTNTNTAALAAITSAARTMLASSTPAVTSLGYTPVNKAGDTMAGTLGLVPMASGGGAAATPSIDNTSQTYSIATGANFCVLNNFSGIVIINSWTNGGLGMFFCGGGSVTLIGQRGTLFANGAGGEVIFGVNNANGNGYYFHNDVASTQIVTTLAIRTRTAR